MILIILGWDGSLLFFKSKLKSLEGHITAWQARHDGLWVEINGGPVLAWQGLLIMLEVREKLERVAPPHIQVTDDVLDLNFSVPICVLQVYLL